MPGSHGSLTKAGKVRSQTPKVESGKKPTPIPRIRNKKNYVKRVLQGSKIGQEKYRR
jgi:small subunit ribosomal protein S30e